MKSPKETAVEKIAGPCIIKAGAGTGKTSVIVEKIVYLISRKICLPEEILCLTFSNEATNNLKNRVDNQMKTHHEITIKTFHSFCADVLREFGESVGIDRGFEIIGPDDARIFLYRSLNVPAYYADLYVSSISTAKDLDVSLEDIKKHALKLKDALSCPDSDHLNDYSNQLDIELKTLYLKEGLGNKKEANKRKKEIKDFLFKYYEYKKFMDFVFAWENYEKMKSERNLLDYADLNFNVLKYFRKFNSKSISGRFKYVLVDEFQDTNKLQFELIKYIAKDHGNITVVGDLNQSIYGFRGAYRESFRHFEEEFMVEEQDVFKLDKSRRCPDSVLRVANTLIRNNYENPDEFFPIENFYNSEGEKVKQIELLNGDEEARKIAEIVEEKISEGVAMREICVLFRTHRQSKLLRQALEAKGILTAVSGRKSIMQSPEIRTAVSFLAVLNNLRERTGIGEQAWWSMFHYRNNLNPEDSVKIGRHIRIKGNDSIDFLLMNDIDEIGLSSEGQKIVKRVVSNISKLSEDSNKTLSELVLDVYALSGLSRAFTVERSVKNIESLLNLKKFYEIAKNYEKFYENSLSGFIKYVEIMEELGVNIESPEINDINAVRVMTMHAVKGLEFEVVIVSNLAEGRFPITRTKKEPLIPKELISDLKKYLEPLAETDEQSLKEAAKKYEEMTLLSEERRLCYVAFTRAKKELILTFARSYGREENSTGPSVFLNEIAGDDVLVLKDDEIKCALFTPCSRYEQLKSRLKKQIIDALDSEDVISLISRIITYHSAREGEVKDYESISIKDAVNKEELEKNILICASKSSCLKFNPEKFTFSPTSLIDYDECPKKYELKHILRMPERASSKSKAADSGSFIHKVLEEGVREGFASMEKFIEYASELSNNPDYKGVDLDDIKNMIHVFWERNKNSYNKESKVEINLKAEIEQLNFRGKADRFDFTGGKDISITDYKTNKASLSPRERAWQLGFYAIAAKQSGYNPVKLVLDMLRLEKPVEMNIDEKGNVSSNGIQGFSMSEVEKELAECAKKIVRDYEGEFIPAGDENKCSRCGYNFYCRMEED